MGTGSTESGRSALEAELVDTLRRRRAELRTSLNALELALAAPAAADPDRWWQRVYVALVELSADLREHLAVNEGPHGLHEEVRRSAPWLSGPVDRLTADHVQIQAMLDRLLAHEEAPEPAELDELRDAATDLLVRLVRHRQRGADLLYEAAAVDLGGGD